MKKKIIFASAVFGVLIFAIGFSYARYGKKVSENTSGTPDGKIFVCRKYAEISKVIAIDSAKKSHKKEVTEWNYDIASGVLTITEDLKDFKTPIFHIEGKPSEPIQFILWNIDLKRGPIGVFLNGKIATENREYIIDEKSQVLTLKLTPKEFSSISIIWHTQDEGISSISEITKKEADLYAELEGAWFTENIKRQILTRDISEDEKRKLIDELPVNVYKFRRNVNLKKLSREAGFKINVPKKVDDYHIVSTMLIESSLKGEKTKTVEFTYDKDDFFSENSIMVTASHFDEKSDTAPDENTLQNYIIHKNTKYEVHGKEDCDLSSFLEKFKLHKF